MNTLSDQLEAWRERERESVSIQAKDPETGKKITLEVPAWLFRGEPKEYPTTYASYQRFSKSELSKTAQAEVVEVTEKLDRVLRQQVGLHPTYSAALLQHYFLPTELLDFTGSLDDAGAFAAYGNSGEIGVLLAFPTDRLALHGELIDLKRIHFARRPRHQHAYVWFHRTEPDLKKSTLFADLRGERVTFQGSHKDLVKYKKHYAEICGAPHTDPTSGLLNKLLEDVVLIDHRGMKLTISSEAREWIDERIPWADVPMRMCKDAPDVMEPAWDRF